MKSLAGVFGLSESRRGEGQLGQKRFAAAHGSVETRTRCVGLLYLGAGRGRVKSTRELDHDRINEGSGLSGTRRADTTR